MPTFKRILEHKEAQQHNLARGKNALDEIARHSLFTDDELIANYKRSTILFAYAKSAPQWHDTPVAVRNQFSNLSLQAYGSIRNELGTKRMEQLSAALKERSTRPDDVTTSIPSQDVDVTNDFDDAIDELMSELLDKSYAASANPDSFERLSEISRIAAKAERLAVDSIKRDNLLVFAATAYHLHTVEQSLLRRFSPKMHTAQATNTGNDWLPKSVLQPATSKKTPHKKSSVQSKGKQRPKSAIVPVAETSTLPKVPELLPFSVRYKNQEVDIRMLMQKLTQAKTKGEAFECASAINVLMSLEGEEPVSMNHLLLDEDGKVRTEIDFETRTAIFEFSFESGQYWQHGPQGAVRVIKDRKFNQVRDLALDKRRNPFGKTVVFFDPFFENIDQLRELQSLGVLTPQTLTELRQTILSLK